MNIEQVKIHAFHLIVSSEMIWKVSNFDRWYLFKIDKILHRSIERIVFSCISNKTFEYEAL